MCDTFVALPDATLNGEVIFGKNSDRPAGEIQREFVNSEFRIPNSEFTLTNPFLANKTINYGNFKEYF